jgi:predicted ATPase
MAAGLSQEALAERARISTEAVGSLERGSRRAPQRQTLALLIAALKPDGPDRERLEAAAIRPSLPRRRQAASSLAGIASPLRVPAPLTSFVGREDDLAELLGALAGARLISLVGPGGVGKSRLALEAARRSSERYRDGIAFVELAPIATGTSVIAAFAVALGVSDEGDVPLADRIVAACGARDQLIVIDNCEHVLYEAAAIAYALLSRCSNVRVIATTREPLRVSGERIFRLGPLAPDQALELFIDRAKAVAPHLQFLPGDREIAAAICGRIDGIPLAIELAASRCDMLDPATILDRLRTRFELLSAASRTALPYHRTLRAMVDWSYELLEPHEALAFRRFAAFAGGCRLDDAERVIAFGDIEAGRVLDLLARLHDKSLVGVDRTDPPRFVMLQTMYDYAREKLHESAEGEELEARHARHYLELSIAAGPVLRGGSQDEAIARLSIDIDNVRAALSRAGSDAVLRETGLRALGALSFFWMRTGALTEGSTWIETFAPGTDDTPAGIAWACVAGAFIELNRHRFTAGAAYAARALEAAVGCADEWLAIYASIADCSARSALGVDAYDEIVAAYERAERAGDPWLILAAAFEWGQAALVRNDGEGAVRHFAAALDLARAGDDAFMVCSASLHLGRALTERDPAEAAHLIGDAFEELPAGAAFGQAACIEALAAVAAFLRRPDDAARLANIASALRGDSPAEAGAAIRSFIASIA